MTHCVFNIYIYIHLISTHVRLCDTESETESVVQKGQDSMCKHYLEGSSSLFAQVYFPIVRVPPCKYMSPEIQWHPLRLRGFYSVKPREMDHGANLFWHCHAGGSAIHSSKANRGGKAGLFFFFSCLLCPHPEEPPHLQVFQTIIVVRTMSLHFRG